MEKTCLIVLVGHHPDRLKFSIEMIACEKIIFIKEKENISGYEFKTEVLTDLEKYYQERLITTEILEYSFTEQTKPIAELTYTICRQKLLGYNRVLVNISGGLRYIIVWFYIACAITKTDVLHGDFKYKGDKEVGITRNLNLVKVPLERPTSMQFEFLSLFLKNPDNLIPILRKNNTIEVLLSEIQSFNSIEALKEVFNKKRKENEKITRGSINGYIKKLKYMSAIKTRKNPNNMKEKIINITYVGLSFLLFYHFTIYKKQ